MIKSSEKLKMLLYKRFSNRESKSKQKNGYTSLVYVLKKVIADSY